jgi:hypothetical protein
VKDTRIVYGAACTWWDSIDKVGKTTSGLPCCPTCGSVLFEMPDEATWWSSVDRHEANGNPGYRDLITWARGKCFRSMSLAKDAFAAREV